MTANSSSYERLEIAESHDIHKLVGEAARAAGARDISYLGSLAERAASGELKAFILRQDREEKGFICYKAVLPEAELVFGHLDERLAGSEEFFIKGVAAALKSQGFTAIRGNFSWQSSRFQTAAIQAGFKAVERFSMAYSPEDGASLQCPGDTVVAIELWDDSYFNSVARIMNEESTEEDRQVYPLFSTEEGCRELLTGILEDRHGLFLRGRSYVALVNGSAAGFLLTSMLSDGSFLVLDIAVSGGHRKKGIACQMLARLIRSLPPGGQILLAVSAHNESAIKLYSGSGFKVTGAYRQYVLRLSHEADGTPSPLYP